MQDILPPKRPKPTPKPAPAAPAAPAIRPAPSMPEPEITIALKDKPKPKGRWARMGDWWKGLSRLKKSGFVALVCLILIVGGAAGYFALFSKSGVGSIAHISIAKKPAKPTTVASPLTGLPVAPDLAARPVTGIMIENSDAARPQSGLQDAGVVYEAIAEAGITRFLALFQDASPQYIGPVRSLRPYYIDFAAPFQATIVHVGGSPDALAEVNNGNYRNLDQFANGAYFTRIDSRDAPHNVYTSFAELDKANAAKGWTSSVYTPWPRKADKKLITPTAKTIQMAISGPDFYANYAYDAKTNTYMRSEAGAPHMELVSPTDTTGVQIHPKVVIAVVMPLSNGQLDSSGAYYSDYTTTGSGTAYVFQDGGVTVGQWTKTDTFGQITFTDSTGKSIKFNAGQTWISLVS
ncbi:MAG TPA: DUF3048 domain-containing protein, partial [Candidatus Binatia bacterium]|nr:DUF3048 domain-containing protein [Candidatus Binatia bacterium]